MIEDIYLTCLRNYFERSFGKQNTLLMMTRILITENVLRRKSYETINKREFFFLVYKICVYLRCNYEELNPVNLIEMALYVVYSFYGPSTSYYFNDFISTDNDDNNGVFTNIFYEMLRSDFTHVLFKLNEKKSFFEHEVTRFITEFY